MDDLKISISNSIKGKLTKLLYNRLYKLKIAKLQHSYLSNWYNKLWSFMITIMAVANTVIIIVGLLISDEKLKILLSNIFSAVNIFMLGLITKFNINEKPSLHKNSKLMVEDIISDLEHSLSRENFTEAALQALSDIFEEKIKAFRSVEVGVPFWVKKKILDNYKKNNEKKG